MYRKWFGVIGAAAAAVGGVLIAIMIGASPGSAELQPTIAVNYVPGAGHHSTSLAGSNEAIAGALTERLKGTSVVKIEVAGPPDDFLPVDDNGDPLTTRPPDPRWIFVTVEATELRSTEAAVAIWEGDLAVGAMRDALTIQGEAVEGARILVRSRNGSIHEVSAGPGEVATGQDFTSPDEAVTPESIQAAAQQFDLVVESVAVVEAEQLAVAVMVQTKTPADTLRRWDEIVAKFFGQTPRFEGFYLQAETPTGDLVALETAAFRSGAGRTY